MNKGIIATVGMFDGVHTGHQLLLKKIVEEGRQRQLSTLVFTFNQHPLSVIAPSRVPKLLISSEEKIKRILNTGIDKVITLDSEYNILKFSARQFMEMLKNSYNTKVLVMGFNNRFGSDRIIDFEDYKKLGDEIGIEVLKGPEHPGVSSSVIRNLIVSKSITEANKALGYNYFLKGSVVTGKQLGRTIGFPTANILPNSNNILVPPNGVYASIATLPDGSKKGAMVNIGHRPTFEKNNNSPVSIEVNIFDFKGNLYGDELSIDFVYYLRDEKQFDSLEDLTAQINSDKKQVLQIINSLSSF